MQTFFLRVQVAGNVPGHGYASANASRPEVVMQRNVSANIFGQFFSRNVKLSAKPFSGRVRRGSGLYFYKESCTAEIWTETSESGA